MKKKIELFVSQLSLRSLIVLALTVVPLVRTTQAKTSLKEQYADKVKHEFLFAWNNYKEYAWGHDELKPLSETYYDWYGDGHSLLITPVDAYDTMVLMGLK